MIILRLDTVKLLIARRLNPGDNNMDRTMIILRLDTVPLVVHWLGGFAVYYSDMAIR